MPLEDYPEPEKKCGLVLIPFGTSTYSPPRPRTSIALLRREGKASWSPKTVAVCCKPSSLGGTGRPKEGERAAAQICVIPPFFDLLLQLDPHEQQVLFEP